MATEMVSVKGVHFGKMGPRFLGGVFFALASAHAQEEMPMQPVPEDELSEVSPEPEAASEPQDVRPEDGTWQTGMGIGLFFPSSELGLVGAGYQPAQFSSAAFEFFGRIGYYPKDFLGVEGEVATMLAGVNNEGAAMYAFRSHVVVQYPNNSVIPFGLVGVGALGGASGLTGHDIDFAFHFGAGLKFPLSRDLAMRFDLRENLSGTHSSSGASIAASEEVAFGIELTIGRAPKRAPVPEPDRDLDGVPDHLDGCPDEGALTADGCPLDTDGDGVSDQRDLCPREVGLLKHRGCPEPDRDADGVDVPCDLCPDVPGKAPDGCPVKDTDEDGLLDDVDQCPGQPESPNGFRDSDGCADEVPGDVRVLLGIQPALTFGAGSAALKPKGSILDDLAQALEKYPEVHLEVVAFAPKRGPTPPAAEGENSSLAESRARAIVDALVARGVARGRLHPKAGSEGAPAGDSFGGLGGERVEILMVTP